MAIAPSVVKVPCTECGGSPTNHKILFREKRPWQDEESGENGAIEYQVCECQGCNTIRFRVDSWDTFNLGPDNEALSQIRVYPERMEGQRAARPTFDYPDSVSGIYVETIKAFNAGALILSGAGLRAIVEAICIEQAVVGNNLKAKIDGLVTKELLAKPQAELLHEERFIGNAALHEMQPPSLQDIEDGLQIIEGLLNTIYTLLRHAERLRKQRAKKR